MATISLPKSPIFLGNSCKVSKSIIFLVKSFLGNFYRYLAIFSGHTGCKQPLLTQRKNDNWLSLKRLHFFVGVTTDQFVRLTQSMQKDRWLCVWGMRCSCLMMLHLLNSVLFPIQWTGKQQQQPQQRQCTKTYFDARTSLYSFSEITLSNNPIIALIKSAD